MNDFHFTSMSDFHIYWNWNNSMEVTLNFFSIDRFDTVIIFKLCLYNQKKYIFVTSKLSKAANITVGLPLGSILRPLFFLIRRSIITKQRKCR